MAYFRAASKRTTDFRDVFQHFADEVALIRLKSTLLDVIFRSVNSIEIGYPHVEDTKESMDPRMYKRLNESIRPNLYDKSFSLNNRTLGYEVVWKWTEATGKFIGCQFWSVQAKDFFTEELKSKYGTKPTFDKAWRCARELNSNDYGLQAINHEHVFPIKKLRQILLNPSSFTEFTSTEPNLEKFFARSIVGCIVLKREHQKIHSCLGNSDNPWLRYTGSSIKLVPNPNWSPVHRQLISDAGLL
jgi:hypothetical protein